MEGFSFHPMHIHTSVLSWTPDAPSLAPVLLSCSFDPATDDLGQLRNLMAFSRRFVHCLRLQQLPSHLDLQVRPRFMRFVRQRLLHASPWAHMLRQAPQISE
jgi:hypothetical protein